YMRAGLDANDGATGPGLVPSLEVDAELTDHSLEQPLDAKDYPEIGGNDTGD
ncbi:MAG TPA: hypothetical protein HA322_00230, partial [Candidatus Poseidoniaceae archaeon]|nr:hypothetical protein [Candidatus Poseidoniaceae archaeon]